MKIYSPNREYNGVTAGVAFANGVGEIEEPEKDTEEHERYEARLQWFESRGFGVGEKPGAEDEEQATNLKGTAKPFSQMSREELNEVALGKGIVGASSMNNKDEVIAAIEEAGGADTED